MELKIKENMNKEEEIEVIRKFYEALPENSYLHMMFEGCVGHCFENIMNDWAINPFEEMKRCYDDKVKAEIEANGLREQVGKLEIEVDKEIRVNKDTVEFYKGSIVELNNKIQKLMYDIDNYAMEVDRLNQEAKNQDEAIMRLKAKLYDLTIGDK
jgi:hypothetical protein